MHLRRFELPDRVREYSAAMTTASCYSTIFHFGLGLGLVLGTRTDIARRDDPQRSTTVKLGLTKYKLQVHLLLLVWLCKWTDMF